MDEVGLEPRLTEENQRLREFIVHLARLALSGREQDIQAYVDRISRRLRHEIPELSEQLAGLVREGPTKSSPLRKGGPVASLPVDADTRLSLARVEIAPNIPHEPVWASSVQRGLASIVTERQHVVELARAGLDASRTAIFSGPPGVGKTLAARWIAAQLRWPLVILDLGAVMSSLLGRTGSNLRNVLDYCKSSNCVLLLDEIDAIAKRRDDQSDVGELKRLVTVLLQQIEDWSDTSLLIAATNHPDLLDPAIWRRFDNIIEFTQPTREQIEQLLEQSLKLPISASLMSALAISFKGQSFSDIERTVRSSRRQAVLQKTDLEATLLEAIEHSVARLDRAARVGVAANLVECGISQRKAHSITGVARETIRNNHRKGLADGRNTTLSAR